MRARSWLALGLVGVHFSDLEALKPTELPSGCRWLAWKVEHIDSCHSLIHYMLYYEYDVTKAKVLKDCGGDFCISVLGGHCKRRDYYDQVMTDNGAIFLTSIGDQPKQGRDGGNPDIADHGRAAAKRKAERSQALEAEAEKRRAWLKEQHALLC